MAIIRLGEPAAAAAGARERRHHGVQQRQRQGDAGAAEEAAAGKDVRNGHRRSPEATASRAALAASYVGLIRPLTRHGSPEHICYFVRNSGLCTISWISERMP